MHNAVWLYGENIKRDRGFEWVDRVHPINIPNMTTEMVRSFIGRGMIWSLMLNGIIHKIVAPPTVDMKDIVSIGVIVVIFSLLEVSGRWRRGPHKVASVKRIE